METPVERVLHLVPKMHMNIRTGMVGRISRGDRLGEYIKIIDDAPHTGGFLILTSAHSSMIKGVDNWVESWQALERYFVESDWIVDWEWPSQCRHEAGL